MRLKNLAQVGVASAMVFATTSADATTVLKSIAFTATFPQPAAPDKTVSGSFSFTTDSAQPAVPLSLTAIDLTIAGHSYAMSEVTFSTFFGPANDPGINVYGILNGQQANAFTTDFYLAFLSVADNTVLNGAMAYSTPSSFVYSSGTLGGQISTTGAVPELGTWAMMIAGFGLVGASLRRRMPTVRTSLAHS